MSHYLDKSIKELMAQTEKVIKEPDGAKLVYGPHGSARIYKKRVCFFEPNNNMASDVYVYKSNRNATLAGLAWVINGFV